MAATYYDILGVATTADAAAIKKAYRRRVRIYHPDRNHDPHAVEQFCLVQRAYETLSSPRARFEYDRQIGVLDAAGRRARQTVHDRPTTVLHPHDSPPPAHGRSHARRRREDEPTTGWRRLERGLIALDVLLLLVVIHQAVLTVMTFCQSSSADAPSWVESSPFMESDSAADSRLER